MNERMSPTKHELIDYNIEKENLNLSNIKLFGSNIDASMRAYYQSIVEFNKIMKDIYRTQSDLSYVDQNRNSHHTILLNEFCKSPLYDLFDGCPEGMFETNATSTSNIEKSSSKQFIKFKDEETKKIKVRKWLSLFTSRKYGKLVDLENKKNELKEEATHPQTRLECDNLLKKMGDKIDQINKGKSVDGYAIKEYIQNEIKNNQDILNYYNKDSKEHENLHHNHIEYLLDNIVNLQKKLKTAISASKAIQDIKNKSQEISNLRRDIINNPVKYKTAFTKPEVLKDIEVFNKPIDTAIKNYIETNKNFEKSIKILCVRVEPNSEKMLTFIRDADSRKSDDHKAIVKAIVESKMIPFISHNKLEIILNNSSIWNNKSQNILRKIAENFAMTYENITQQS